MSWENAKAIYTEKAKTEEKKQFEDVPAGSYQCVIDDCDPTRITKTGGYDSILYVLRVLTGRCEGWTIFKHDVILPDDKITDFDPADGNFSVLRAMTTLARLEVPIPETSHRDIDVNQVVGKKCNVAVKEGNNGRMNVYINSLIKTETLESGPPAKKYDDDGLPF
jgi:hypothetical protein